MFIEPAELKRGFSERTTEVVLSEKENHRNVPLAINILLLTERLGARKTQTSVCEFNDVERVFEETTD